MSYLCFTSCTYTHRLQQAEKDKVEKEKAEKDKAERREARRKSKKVAPADAPKAEPAAATTEKPAPAEPSSSESSWSSSPCKTLSSSKSTSVSIVNPSHPLGSVLPWRSFIVLCMELVYTCMLPEQRAKAKSKRPRRASDPESQA